MGTMKRLAVFALLLAVGVYWLTSPIPEGYSFGSAMELRKLNAMLKFFGVATHVSRMFGSTEYINVSRSAEISQFGITIDISGVAIEEAIFDSIPVNIYRPKNQKKLLPGFVYYHGGGWVLGSVASYHGFVVNLCKKTNAVFVSVDYRRAPEHVFPAAFDDSVAATKYFLLHAKKFKVDPHRVSIGGDSAGGNLAAAVALKLRDDKFEPKVKMQILIYPVLQNINYQLPSMIQNADGPILSRRGMALFASLYLVGSHNHQDPLLSDIHVSSVIKQRLASTHLNINNLPEKYRVGYTRPNVEAEDEKLWDNTKDTMLNPYFSPLLADDVSRLPMTYVFTCEHDVLRDEAMLYVHRLSQAGNAVTHINAHTGFHGILSLGFKWPETKPMFDQMTKYIVDNL